MTTNKVDILAIGVHPDDIELSASGTLFRHLDLGYSIALCDLTQGELGTRGSAALRLEEAEAARKHFGDVPRVNLGLADGFFTHTRENLMSIVKVIRQFQPEIVLCNAISDRHPDHGRAAKLVSDACFLAGLRKIIVDGDEDLAAWRPKSVYHYTQDRHQKVDFAVDITDYMDRKIAVIKAFKSQFFDPDSKEPLTPISGPSFIDSVKSKDRVYGRDLGVDYAEGFNVDRCPGVNNLFDLF
ncbi:MAG TPA: bacillithiol biosynthesis deacetylase BshB1 [Saprospiraceae bacterium]|jgi:bacillithiol biosynthesis deacetylase BshB1|nr:bacillithiol biosynthesis deacetylase BshB1 [Saprospiraceae bacterium]HRO07433.1 bacillithiol biosynthesis deacetylase BshB1 [Saprospiraceae bacterium]HRO73521.1 bacillithiol biosynthesis deacetylase BshB1 [Saprospiraceae bacterium]HRP40716.1 bacillithiol biosynthesis deacetylase BshB1 [Saprospiraceae bacterium]